MGSESETSFILFGIVGWSLGYSRRDTGLRVGLL